MEAEESLAESDGGSYFNQSETWPEEVKEVNVKNANSKLVSCSRWHLSYQQSGTVVSENETR